MLSNQCSQERSLLLLFGKKEPPQSIPHGLFGLDPLSGGSLGQPPDFASSVEVKGTKSKISELCPSVIQRVTFASNDFTRGLMERTSKHQARASCSYSAVSIITKRNQQNLQLNEQLFLKARLLFLSLHSILPITRSISRRE